MGFGLFGLIVALLMIHEAIYRSILKIVMVVVTMIMVESDVKVLIEEELVVKIKLKKKKYIYKISKE